MTIQEFRKIYEGSIHNVNKIMDTVNKGFETPQEVYYNSEGYLPTGEKYSFNLFTSNREFNKEKGKVYVTVGARFFQNDELKYDICKKVEKDMTDITYNFMELSLSTQIEILINLIKFEIDFLLTIDYDFLDNWLITDDKLHVIKEFRNKYYNGKISKEEFKQLILMSSVLEDYFTESILDYMKTYRFSLDGKCVFDQEFGGSKVMDFNYIEEWESKIDDVMEYIRDSGINVENYHTLLDYIKINYTIVPFLRKIISTLLNESKVDSNDMYIRVYKDLETEDSFIKIQINDYTDSLKKKIIKMYHDLGSDLYGTGGWIQCNLKHEPETSTKKLKTTKDYDFITDIILADFKNIGINIEDPNEFIAYILQHPTILPILKAMIMKLLDKIDKEKVYLCIYNDPESDDSFIEIQINDYTDSLEEEVLELYDTFKADLTNTTGWIQFTRNYNNDMYNDYTGKLPENLTEMIRDANKIAMRKDYNIDEWKINMLSVMTDIAATSINYRYKKDPILSQEELAKELNIDKKIILDLEEGKYSFSIETLFELIHKLGGTILLEWNEFETE